MKKLIFYTLTSLLLLSCSYKVTKYQNTYKISKKGTNFYLIEENSQYLMIDTGTPNNGEKIEKTLIKNKINPNHIKHIVLTHAHYDHAGNAAYFKNKFGSKIIASKGDKEIIASNGKDTNLCPTSFFAKIGKSFVKNKDYQTFIPDTLISKAYDLSKIGFTGKIIPLAGHTPGSLIIETNKQIFVGDLIRGSLFKNSKPKRHFFMCDLQDNDTDIKFVSDLSDNKIWFLGHSGPITNKEVVKFIKTEATPKTNH